MTDYEPLLSLEELYWREIAQLPELDQEQVALLVRRVQSGENEARVTLIEGCLPPVSRIAWRAWRQEVAFRGGRYPAYSYLDLVQVGNLALLNKFEYAIELAGNPVGYLIRSAQGQIEDYCIYRGGLIPVPVGIPFQPLRPHVDSLDATSRKRQATPLSIEFDFVKELEPEARENAEALYETLYAEVENLSPTQREVVVRHYGLLNQPEESLADIGRSISPNSAKNSVVYHHYKRALAKLLERLK